VGTQEPALKALIRDRHLTYESFCREWDRAARGLDDHLVGKWPGRAQYYRWLRGELVNGRPYPDACRMLEAMFPDWSVESLFAPYTGNTPEPLSGPQTVSAGVPDQITSGISVTSAHPDVDPPLMAPASSGPLNLYQIEFLRDTLSHDAISEAPKLLPKPVFVTPDLDINPGSGEDLVDVLGRIQKLHRGTVNPEVISQLQANAQYTVAQYEELEHSAIVPALLKQRALINELLSECSQPRQQRQLYEISGAMSGVLGYIAVGRADFALARAYTLEAFQLGDFAEDANLQAWARGLQSFCEYYAGRYDDALSLARDGLNYARSGPQSVRLAINGAARAIGKIGDTDGVHRAVAEAYDLMSCNDVPEGVPSSISFECYSAAQTASNAATAYVSLGTADKVQHYVDLALPDISNSGSPWSYSLVMIDLALSVVRAQETGEADLDRATELILNALRISADRPIISIHQRVYEFVRDATGRWGNTPQVQAVLDAMSVLKVR